MSTPVLFDVPGPQARARQRIGAVIGYMVITLPLAYAVHRIERRVAILR